MIELVVIFCMKLNPTMCQTLEMIPDDGREITSIMECIRGGVIAGMTFTKDNTEWEVKGHRCVERPNVVTQWMKDKDKIKVAKPR